MESTIFQPRLKFKSQLKFFKFGLMSYKKSGRAIKVETELAKYRIGSVHVASLRPLQKVSPIRIQIDSNPPWDVISSGPVF